MRAHSWPALLLVVALAAPAGAAGGPAEAALTPSDGALFGVAVAPGQKDAPYQPLSDLEAKLGRKVAIDRYDRAFGTAFPDGREQWDVAAGRIPMVSWGPVATGEVNRGSWDTQIRLRARGVKSLGQPILIDWFADAANPRNTAVVGDASQYVAAFRRIRRLFTEEDARNAVWVWCADGADYANGTADAWYPGDDNVDWICADAYNPRNPARPDSTAASFEDLFTPFHSWGAHHDKPMMIGRYGTGEDNPGDKPAWVNAARHALETNLSGIDAVVYDSTQLPAPTAGAPGDDWRMDTSDDSMAAFKAMGADPWFNPAVETTLPDTVLESGPQKVIAAHEATFGFSAAGAKATGFECHVDRAKWQPCTSPHTVTGLPDGKHSFEVRALGTGGRPDPTPAHKDWTVDTTGPEVTATSPKDGATDASPAAEITATFSEALDPSSVVGDTFKLIVQATGEVVSATVTYDPATRKAKLRPEKALLPMAAYRATITAVKDLVGNPMAKDHEWSFQTTVDTTPPQPSKPEPAPEPPAPKPAPPSPPKPGR